MKNPVVGYAGGFRREKNRKKNMKQYIVTVKKTAREHIAKRFTSTIRFDFGEKIGDGTRIRSKKTIISFLQFSHFNVWPTEIEKIELVEV
jgi:hypothetical protein